MTKKQILLLVSIALLAFIVLFLFGAWRMQPFNGPLNLASTITPVLELGIKAQNEILPNQHLEGNEDEDIQYWPTITPRPISENTLTPAPIEYQQIPTNDEILVEQTHTPTLVFTPTSTNLPLESSSNIEEGSPFSIGKSTLGNDLFVHKFGEGSIRKLIVAGIHGGYEYNTTDLANELIAFLQINPEIIPENTTLYILPSFNPDGLARSFGYAGRANANNVDLNRNWDFNWKSEWDPAGCWAYLPINGGTAPFSEPETAALRDFIHSHNFTAILSYHSAALGVFPGGAPDINISEGLAETIAQVVPYPYPPIQTGCEITGQFVDYTASFGIPALDIELTNHKDSDFEINLEVLKAFLSWSP